MSATQPVWYVTIERHKPQMRTALGIRAGGLKSAHDDARLSGARILAPGVPPNSDIAGVALTADFATVAIVRNAVHRNLYRLPLP